MTKKTITILGMGYIGLPTATMFADAGHKVYGYDVDNNVIDILKTGNIHIVEPDLNELFRKAVNSESLIPTTKIYESDVYIICVPTPFKEESDEKKVDLSYVESASKVVANVLKKGDLVILESTVPPETTDIFMNDILSKESGLEVNKDYYIAHCPERVLPGQILRELKENDRVIGVSNEHAGIMAKDLYSSIVTIGNIYITDSVTAEMCKLVENTFRDINIAFANELSVICDKLKINVWELITLANKHPRVNILKPGVGVGGHCLAVDPWFIVEKYPEDSKLIRSARETNEFKSDWIIEKVKNNIGTNVDKKNITIGVLGLAYKSDIDDLRESPSLKIALNLKEAGFNVVACEPNSKETIIKGIKNLSSNEIKKESDYLLITQNHSQFKNIELSSEDNIFDLIGFFESSI